MVAGNNQAQINLSLSEDMDKQIEDYANKLATTKTAVVKIAIDFFLTNRIQTMKLCEKYGVNNGIECK